MKKKILFTFMSIFLIFQSLKIVNIIAFLSTDSWMVFILLSALVNLFVTGVFAFAGFVHPTERLMPSIYYNVSNTSFQKKIYKVLGVEKFRIFLLTTVWKKKSSQKKFFDGTKSGIDNLIVQTQKSDFGHLLPFVILLILAIYWVFLGNWEIALISTIINVFFNFYPIILQRQHRMRIQLLRKRLMPNK